MLFAWILTAGDFLVVGCRLDGGVMSDSVCLRRQGLSSIYMRLIAVVARILGLIVGALF